MGPTESKQAGEENSTREKGKQLQWCDPGNGIPNPDWRRALGHPLPWEWITKARIPAAMLCPISIG